MQREESSICLNFFQNFCAAVSPLLSNPIHMKNVASVLIALIPLSTEPKRVSKCFIEVIIENKIPQFVSGIDFACFYNFPNGFSKCSDVVVFIVIHFINVNIQKEE